MCPLVDERAVTTFHCFHSFVFVFMLYTGKSICSNVGSAGCGSSVQGEGHNCPAHQDES